MALNSTHTRRPRYRKHRRQSRKLAAFLAAMATKWSGQETTIAASAVGSDVVALASTPDVAGPFTLRGAVPVGFPRDVNNVAKRFWLSVDGSDNATIYTSRQALAAARGGLDIASWDLSPDMTSLTATAPVINTLDAVDTVATLTTLGTCTSVGAGLAISAVTAGADSLTRVGHGFVADQGPFYIASDGDIPAGLAATTPYWIKTVLTPDTFTLAASLGGAVIDITDAGTGSITIAPVNVDVSLDTLEVTAHGLATGDGPLRVATDTTLPTGLVAATDYWAIVTTANRFKLATTRALAIDGTAVNLTGVGAGIQTVSKCNVDTTTEKFYSLAHGLTTGQLVRVSTDGALPTGLVAATNYWVIRVDANYFQLASSLANANAGTAISLTAVGSGTTTVSRCNIDTTLDTYRAVAHGFATGDGPVRASSGTTLPTGVSANTDYWIIRVDADNFKLATTEANALAGTPVVDITAIGAGTQTITLAGVDVTEDHLRVVAHGMVTGDGPVRVSTTGTLPVGLIAATDYWVVRISADTFGLATSRALALAGTKVNLTGIGVGTHQLVRALTIGKDLSADGLLEWLAQGVAEGAMRGGAVEDVDAIFV